jgi:hypothetical protein
MLAMLPFAFLFFLFLGRKYMKITVPDPFNIHSEPELLDILQSPFYKLVYSWLSLILISLLAWTLLIGFVGRLSTFLLGVWSILAAFSLLISCIIAFAIGGAYMEDRRKFGLILGGFLTILLSGSILFPPIFNWKNLSSLYILGILSGLLLGLVTIKYGLKNWNPALLITVFENPSDYTKDSSRAGQLFALIFLFGLLIRLEIISDKFSLPFLGMWLVTTFSYSIVQGIRYRPHPKNIYDSTST